MLLWPEIGGNEQTECWWVSLWDVNLGGLFCPFFWTDFSQQM